MAKIGICGRNEKFWPQKDYDLIKFCGFELVKMMSLTAPEVFKRIQEENPGIEFITRLFDDRFGEGHHPSPQNFANKMSPIIEDLGSFCSLFQVHNEPNHIAGYEGWLNNSETISERSAMEFNNWFLEVYSILKRRHRWASFGFPGLAVPHRDFEWLFLCKEAINKADWAGVHCYWQHPKLNHLADFWGKRFQALHTLHPDKDIHILECGNSSHQNNIPLPEYVKAEEAAEYIMMLEDYTYIKSASWFIASSPDRFWDGFTWYREDTGDFKPIAHMVGTISIRSEGD